MSETYPLGQTSIYSFLALGKKERRRRDLEQLMTGVGAGQVCWDVMSLEAM
jgi:hypothetical protein